MTAGTDMAQNKDGTVGKALHVLDMVAEKERPIRFNDLLAHRARCHTQFQTRAAQITFTSQHLDGSKTL